VDSAATEMDDITADKNDATIDGDDDHAQSDEEDDTEAPEEGYIHKALSVIMTATKEPMIQVESLPPANTAKSKEEEVEKPIIDSGKITESPLSKKTTKSPEALNPVTSKPEQPHDALHHQMKTGGGSEDDKTVIETMQDEITKLRAKMMEMETNQSALLARMTELDTKPPSVGTAETSEPTVATEAALIAVEETTDNDDALTGRTFAAIPDPIGQMSDGTEAPNMPESIAPGANAASKTNCKANKVARTSTDQPEVGKEIMRMKM
jgi:hypothetical protein